jgi:hypothetical protein
MGRHTHRSHLGQPDLGAKCPAVCAGAAQDASSVSRLHRTRSVLLVGRPGFPVVTSGPSLDGGGPQSARPDALAQRRRRSLST